MCMTVFKWGEYMTVKETIASGKAFLGIEFGSTRVKAVLTDESSLPIASGAYDWENSYKDGIWYYPLEQIHEALRGCYASLCRDVQEKYGTVPTAFAAMGVSGMMHGYMAFDKEGRLLVPFRTWRNTITAQAAGELSQTLGFNIPQRWSVAHLYQAVLNGEEHIPQVETVNTLAGYIFCMLTGKRSVGIGEASGIFPVDGRDYNAEYIAKTEALLSAKGFDKKMRDVFPAVSMAGEKGAFLTEAGALFLDPSGTLKAGVPVCPPEGDAGTGMTATNSVRERTGNISAGTSIFSMAVLDRPLENMYPEIDVVATPDGKPVAMVHCNNCCSELDSWVNMFGEFAALTGHPMDKSELYSTLYKNALTAPADCSGAAACNFLSGEPVVGVDEGRPMYMRLPDSHPTLGAFFRAELCASFAALKLGNDLLFRKEKITADRFNGHGGLFKVEGVASQLMADALGVPVAVMTTAGEGGAWGMALLARYMTDGDGMSLADWLDIKVFADSKVTVSSPDPAGSEGFEKYMENYTALLRCQRLNGKENQDA